MMFVGVVLGQAESLHYVLKLQVWMSVFCIHRSWGNTRS